MEYKDWDIIFRILKQHDIQQSDVAKVWTVDTTYVSKIKKGKELLTPENFKIFNQHFGHIVTLDKSLINSKKSGKAIDYDDLNSPEALRTTIRAIQELLLDTYQKVYKVDHIEARQALGRKLVEFQSSEHKKDIQPR